MRLGIAAAVAAALLVVALLWQSERSAAPPAPASPGAIAAPQDQPFAGEDAPEPRAPSLRDTEPGRELPKSEPAAEVEAADRLAAHDERRAVWERRLAAYRSARDAITADAGLDPAARDAEIETLRARLFDARERIRVRALDEIESADPPPPD